MKTLTLLFLLGFSSVCFAGSEHDHSPGGHGHSHGAPATSMKKTQEIGEFQIKRLITAGKLDTSWAKSIFDKSEQKKFGSRTEWVVTFDNENGVKGKKIYIFLKLNGDFVAANFTGL